jgi:hypothetical protein
LGRIKIFLFKFGEISPSLKFRPIFYKHFVLQSCSLNKFPIVEFKQVSKSGLTPEIPQFC